MMPKGVEHPKTLRLESVNDSVKIPMMPKGVEHIVLSLFPGIDLVKIPMMPKGVEHSELRLRD